MSMTRKTHIESRLITKDQLCGYSGLTSRPLPGGWSGPDDSSKKMSGTERTATAAQQVKMNKAIAPVGWRRSWRYFKGLLAMLRRPSVMHDYPIHLQLETTDACNLNCTMCSRDMLVEKPSLLKPEYWKGIIDELRPANINVSGIGEPFLHPEIYEIIAYAKSKGSLINCATNFTRIGKNHRKLVECGKLVEGGA
jgi:hypothetical protein